MERTRILVSGGFGFIGSNFIRHLLKANGGTEVVNIDAVSYGSNPSNLTDLRSDDRYKFVRGSITNKSIVRPLVNQADFVMNFAAQTHVDRSISSGLPFMRSNAMGVLTILEALRLTSREIPFVQIGTDEEYGEIARGSFTEDEKLTPSSPYAATKAAASMLVLAYARTYGMYTIITRCTNNYGPYQSPEKLIPKSIIRAHLGLKVPIYGNGKNIREWIHVVDHCEALELVMREGKPGSIYNVAGGRGLENIELVNMILDFMGKPRGLIELVEDRPGHDRRYSLDDRKIRKELGWRPRRKFEDALRETVQWYMKNEKWWRPIADEKTLSAAPWKLRW